MNHNSNSTPKKKTLFDYFKSPKKSSSRFLALTSRSFTEYSQEE